MLLIDGAETVIGPRAFDLLLVLIERRGCLIDQDTLLKTVWPRTVEPNNLTVQMSALRKLLGQSSILTVARHGYRFMLKLDSDEGATAGPGRVDSAAAALPPDVGQLPAPAPLYGRDEDAVRVAAGCASAGLVTLCGSSGIGKTKLAMAVARQLMPGFEHGCRMVELESVREPGLLAPALAQCLGIVLTGHAPPHDELARALQPRTLLLVIDNCEHLIDTLAPLVHVLLGAAPHLHILATSQRPLRVAGERVYRLAHLAVPPPGDLDRAESFGAVRLFFERVRAQQGGFEPTPRDAADAVEICRQLDGIALAIELAAGRVPLLGVAGVRRRLDEKLSLLTGGSRGATGRHQTLRTALEASHQLLNPAGQTLLRRLGVFTGSFSLEAAQLVAGESDGQAIDALEHLGLMVDCSLLNVEGGEPVRYRMLGSMREFAVDRLEAAGETQAWQRVHAHAMRDICRLAARKRDSAWIWAEMNNARAALTWALSAPGEGEVAVAIATYTAVVLATAGPVPEAMNNLLRVQHLVVDTTPAPLAARFWQWLGRFGIEGRLPSSRCIDALERALAMFEQLSDQRHVHACRRMLAEAFMRMGDLASAQRQLEAAVGCETADCPPADRMRRLRIAGLLADSRGQWAESMRLAQLALQIAEAHRIQRYCLMLMADMAWVQLRMGEPAGAAERLRELLRRIEPSPREGLNRAYALAGLMAALVASEQLAQAREYGRADWAAILCESHPCSVTSACLD